MELPAELAGEEPDELFEVWPENERALELFISLTSQWEIAVGMGPVTYVRIPAESIEAALRLRGVKPNERRGLFEQLLIMQAPARRVFNARADG